MDKGWWNSISLPLMKVSKVLSLPFMGILSKSNSPVLGLSFLWKKWPWGLKSSMMKLSMMMRKWLRTVKRAGKKKESLVGTYDAHNLFQLYLKNVFVMFWIMLLIVQLLFYEHYFSFSYLNAFSTIVPLCYIICVKFYFIAWDYDFLRRLQGQYLQRVGSSCLC